jgi:hypothetical protein
MSTKFRARVAGLVRRLRRRIGAGRAGSVAGGEPVYAYWHVLGRFRELLATAPAPTAPETGDPVRVGFAVFGAGVPHLIVDHLLAAALEQRGAVSQFFVCDLPSLPACDERLAQVRPNDRCRTCIAQKRPFLEASGVDWVPLSRFLGDAPAAEAEAQATVAALRDDEITGFCVDGWPVGSWLGSSVAGYLRADSHGDAPDVVAARRSFLVSGILALRAVTAWLDDYRPDVVVVLSGRHLFWRAAREVAQARGIKVVSREMYDESFDRQLELRGPGPRRSLGGGEGSCVDPRAGGPDRRLPARAPGVRAPDRHRSRARDRCPRDPTRPRTPGRSSVVGAVHQRELGSVRRRA